MSIINNYQSLKEEIYSICLQCGRDPLEITLLCVSKGHSWEEAQFLYEAGARLFAENRVLEALEKIALAPKDIQWHFIGNLQRNKVRKIIGHFDLIHSVDSLSLCKEIDRISLEKGIFSNVLLEANTSGEESKHGLKKEEWLQYIDEIFHLKNLRVIGLMTMAPYTEDEKIIRSCFSGLRELRDELEKLAGVKLPHLSMGMSNDYKIAIEEGATILRIGSKLFS